MKFLAVLAVLAMAFAAFAVVAPAETDDATATTTVWNFSADPNTLTINDDFVLTATDGLTLTAGTYYYVPSSMSVKITKTAVEGSAVLLLLENGATVDVNMDNSDGATTIYVHVLGVTKSGNVLSLHGDYSSTAIKTAWAQAEDYTVPKIVASEDGDPATCANQNFAVAAGDNVTLKFTEYNHITYASTADLETPVVSAVMHTTDAFGTMWNASGDVSVFDYYEATGTITSTQAGGDQKVKITDFTGKLTVSAAGIVTVSEWKAGDIEVVKAASGKDVIIDAGCADGTLTVDKDAYAKSYDGAIDYNLNVAGSGTFTFGGAPTISLTVVSEIPLTYAGKIIITGVLISDLTQADAISMNLEVQNGGRYAGTMTFMTGTTVNEKIMVDVTGGVGNATIAHGDSIDVGGFINANVAGSFIKGIKATKIIETTITGGSFDILGVVETAGELTLVGTTLNIDKDATLTIGNDQNIDLSNNSVLNIAGNLTLADVSDTATFDNVGGTAIVKTTATGTVHPAIASQITVITDDSMETQYVYDTALGHHSYPASQTLIVDGSWTLAGYTYTNPADIYVSGKLIVPEGSTLVIEDGAKLVLENSAVLEVYGKIIIDEDEDDQATDGYYGGLFVNESGAVYVSGQIVNGGAIVIDDNQTFTLLSGATLTNEDSGAISTGAASKLTVAKGAELKNLGKMDSAKVYNFGTITINSDYAARDITTIYQMGDGAIVNVNLYTIDVSRYTNAGLIITDDGMHLYTYRDSTLHDEAYVVSENVNTVTITAALMNGDAYITSDYVLEFANLTVVSSVVIDNVGKEGVKYGTNYYEKAMDVSGTIDVGYTYVATTGSGSTTYTATSKVTASAADGADYMTVTGVLLVKDNSAFELASGNMILSGAIATESTAGSFTKSVDSTFTVVGDGIAKIYGVPLNARAGINATELVIPTPVSNRTVKVYTYVTIDNALEYLASAEDVANEATILGINVMTESADLYASDKLIDAGVLYISDGITLTIKDGAELKGTGIIYVDGTMFAENKSNVKISEDKISADVKTVQLDSKGKVVKDGWAKWTNIISAINSTDDGTVTITRANDNPLQDYVAIASNLTIPAGVTLNIPGNAAPLVLFNGVTLTVNGAVVIGSGADIKAQTDFNLVAYNVVTDTDGNGIYSSAIIVNGSLTSAANIVYGNGNYGTTTKKVTADDWTGKSLVSSTADSGAIIAGAYYTVNGYHVISSLEIALANIEDIDGNFTVYGAVAAGNVTFAATEYVNQITVHGVNFTYDAYPAGLNKPVANTLTVEKLTIVCPSGVSSAKIIGSGSVTGAIASSKADITVKGVSGMTVSVSSTGAMALTGTAATALKGDYLNIVSGEVSTGVASPATAFVVNLASNSSMAINEGATLKVAGATTLDNVTVNGTLSVPASKTLNLKAEKTMTIKGTLDVAKASASSAPGIFNVLDEATIYIGITKKDMQTSAAASVSGPVAFADDARVFIGSGASVDSSFTDCLGTTTTAFYVEGALWFTAYLIGDGASTVTVDKVSVSNAVLDGWATTNGGAAYNFGTAVNPNYYTPTIGAKSALYAVLDYDIYAVIILADQGVKNVSIDGVLLRSEATGTDTFATVANLEAGTHTVAFSLYSGHEGTAILQYVDATEGVTATILGMNFTVSGDNEGTVTLQLVGIEEIDPVPEEKSEWTITTILLVILVILIAVMAVIVALRLNRS